MDNSSDTKQHNEQQDFGGIKKSLFVRISSLCGVLVTGGFLMFAGYDVVSHPLSFVLYFGLASYVFAVLLSDLFKRETASVVVLLLGMDVMCLSGFLDWHFQFFTIVLIPLVPSFTFLLLGFRTGVRWFSAFLAILIILGFAPLGGVSHPSDLGFVIAVILGTINIAGFSLLFQKHLEDSRLLIQQQLAEITRLSLTDPLTHIYNRRAFLELLEGEFARSRRIEWRMGAIDANLGHLSFLLFDIDHFKDVNDRFGHPIGDKVLCAVAGVFHDSSFLRETDCVARYGGEEFIVFEPDTNTQGALLSAERIRKHIEEMPLVNEAGETFTISISCGITERTGSDVSLEQVISRADKALYESKHQGRNRSTIYSEGESAG